MRPGSAVATACLAVVSVWRWTDGEPGWAALFAGLALAQLGFALHRGQDAPRRSVRRPSSGGGRRAPAPEDAAARRGWVRIAVANLVLALAAVFWFPPLALVLAGLGLYSAHRARTPSAAAVAAASPIGDGLPGQPEEPHRGE